MAYSFPNTLTVNELLRSGYCDTPEMTEWFEEHTDNIVLEEVDESDFHKIDSICRKTKPKDWVNEKILYPGLVVSEMIVGDGIIYSMDNDGYQMYISKRKTFNKLLKQDGRKED